MPALKPTGPKIGGLPIYTKQQFLQVKPTGSYNAYVNFIKRRRLQGPATPGQAGLPNYETLLRSMPRIESPAQLEARAKRMAEESIGSQRTMIQEEAALAAKQAQEKALALSAAGRAAAQMNAGLFGAVGGEYNAAARELGALGSLTGGMAAQTAADVGGVNAGLASIGQAPVEASGVLAGPGQAGVESTRGPGIGQQNIGTQGEASTFGLAGLISSQNLRATQEANLAYTQTEREINQKRMSAITELARGRPEAAAKYLLQLQDAQRQQIALTQSLIEARLARGDQNLQNFVTRQENRREELTTQADLTAAGVDLAQVDALKSKALGYVVDKQGKPIKKNGRKIPYSAIKEAVDDAASDLTPNQRQSLMTTLDQKAQEFAYGYVDLKMPGQRKKRVPAYTQGETSGKGMLGYYDARKRLLGLAGKGLPDIEIDKILRRYYDRGELGGPIFYSDERTRLKKLYGAAKYDQMTKHIRLLLRRGQDNQADQWIAMMLNEQQLPALSAIGRIPGG